jgi:alkane 1-monooxygenase
LHHRENAPQLPYGYGAMVVLALLPPVWFQLMDSRVKKFNNRFN